MKDDLSPEKTSLSFDADPDQGIIYGSRSFRCIVSFFFLFLLTFLYDRSLFDATTEKGREDEVVSHYNVLI